MKKTLKLVAIFMAIMTIGIAGGLSVYYLIQSNKTYYIYDLRIVEAVEEAPTYIYTNKTNNYATLKNKKVYMTAGADNMFEIAVFAETTNGTSNLKITSSNPSVADIVYMNGKCYVEYKKAGEATITAKIDMVTDSFDLYVYNQIADGFNVYDRTYYGVYSEMFSNKVVAYADDKPYEYDFLTNSVYDDADDQSVNGDLLEVDATSVNSDVFADVSIDASSRKLLITCKASLSQKLIEEQKLYLDESIVIQSYYYSTEGDKKPSKSYVVDVHVIADTPEFLQVVMSATPDFANSYVLMDTKDFTTATEEEIITDIDNFLDYQKAEQYLSEMGEKSTYTAFFTNKVSEIYLRFRKVYTNGDIVYLDEFTKEEGNPFTITCEEGYLTLSQNKEYYTLKVNKDYFYDANVIARAFTINLKLDDFTDFDSTFTFEFKEFTAENVTDFYGFDYDNRVFVYKYWDLRTRYNNEICDANGNVIDFGGIDVDLESFGGVKFVSDLYDQVTGKAIFEVELNKPTKLEFISYLTKDIYTINYSIPIEGQTNAALNRSRFTFDNGEITITSEEFEQIEIKVEVNGYTDQCIIRLKSTQ